MIELYHRSANPEELKELNSRQPSAWTKVERFALKLVFITIVLLVPFLVMDKFFPIPSQTEGIILMAMALVAVLGTIYWTKRDPEVAYEDQLKRTSEIEIIHCTTKRAIKREDPEDFGVSFYLDIGDGRTLFLQGQYLDLLEYDKKFPNSDFELLRTKDTKDFIDLKVKGNYFKPDRILKAFTLDDYKKGIVPEDGEILDIDFKRIK